MPNTADIAAEAGSLHAALSELVPVFEHAMKTPGYGQDESSREEGEDKLDRALDAIAKYEARILAAIEPQAVAEPVGEVVNLTGSLNDMAVIQWVSGFQPILGAKLYAVPVTASDERAVAAGTEFNETLNFYISDAENGICRVPRQKLVEIRQALTRSGIARCNSTPPKAVMRAPVTDAELDQWASTRADDAGRLARELIGYRLAAAPKAPAGPATLHGPYGYLIKPHGLSEEHWHLTSQPSESDDETSVPLFAEEEQILGVAAPLPAGPSSKETAK